MRGTWNRCASVFMMCVVAAAVFAAPAAFAVVQPDRSQGLHQKEYAHPDLYYRNVFVPIAGLEVDLSRQLGADLVGLGVDPANAYFDRRTGRWGTLILTQPLIPGTGVGNDLQWSDLGVAEPRGEEALERAAGDAFRTYLVDNAAALRIDPEQIGEMYVTASGNHLVQIHIERAIDGIPVRDTFVQGMVNSGNLVIVGTRNWNDTALSTAPRVSEGLAEETLQRYLDGFPVQRLHERPRLEIVPVSDQEEEDSLSIGGGVEYRMVWALRPYFGEDLGEWEALVDAHDGELLAFTDLRHYASRRVEGGIYPVSNDQVPPDGVEVPDFPMPFANILLDGNPIGFTTTGGNVPPAGNTGTISTTLSGQFVRTADVCGATNESSAAGDLDLLEGPGTDCTVPAGHSAGDTHASRSGFYELNRLKEQARGYLPANAWLAGQLTANMNQNNICNANWNGSTVNFYRSGGGCANTGEIAAIFDHEWGHGMDNNDGLPNISRPGEGIADIFAINRLNTSCVGRNFRPGINCGGYGDPCTECTGVRDTDWAKRASGVPHTIAWIDANCPAGGGTPCGGATHCEGAIVSESAWDLVHRDLMGFGGSPFNLDLNTALELGTRLAYFGSSTVFNWYQCVTDGTGGCNADSGYLHYIAADDDNGNLTDGTPHMSAIFAAFNRHQMACPTPTVQNAGCAGGPTTAPTNLSADVFDEGMELSWDAVAGATGYQIFRTEGVNGCDFGKALVGETTGTTFTETGLRNGMEILYSVVAVGATDACTSPMSSCLPVTPVSGPSGFISGTVTDAGTAAPIEGAVVEAVGAVTVSDVTDASGNYQILAPVDTYDVTATAEDYDPETESDVVVTDGGTTDVDFALSLTPVPVADVSPTSFTFDVVQGDTAMDTLNIGNLGQLDLTWTLTEDAPTLVGPGGSNFEGDYAIENWELVNNPPGVGGSFNTNPGPPVELFVVGGDADVAGDTDFQITVPVSGEITFDWGYQSGDTGNFDRGGYAINGAFTQLANNDTQVPFFDETHTVAVTAGDVFAFRVFTEDGAFGAGTFGVTNFTFGADICDDANDVPWLSASPTSGTAEPGTTDPVTVTVDSSALSIGTHVAGVCVATNDPDQPVVPVPITVNVEGDGPVADVNPAFFNFTVAEGGTDSDTLNMGNTGNQDLTWSLAEAPPSAIVLGRHVPIAVKSAGSALQTQRAIERGEAPAATASFAGGAGGGPLEVVPGPATLGDVQMSQTPDTNIVPANSIACPTGPNHWFRRFYFSEHPGVGNPATINSVDFAIQEGVATQTLTVNLYTIPSSTPVDTIPLASLTSIGTGSVSISPANDGTIVNVPVSGTVSDTAAMDLVVEATVAGGMFPGATDTSQTHPGFIMAPACGLTAPGVINTIPGFEDTFLIMIVNAATGGGGGGGDCENPADVPWLSVTPTNGTTPADSTVPVTVAVDSDGLAPGTYSASVCATTNDPGQTLIDVPVSLTVSGSAPVADISPDSFSFEVPEGGNDSDTLSIGNTGDADLIWSLEEAETAVLQGEFFDDFDSYADGSQMHGQGGWKGWDNSPAAGALVSSAQSNSSPHSVEIVGASDLVHEFEGITDGQWTIRAMQFIPTDFSGLTYWIMLNTYSDGGTNNWSTQVSFAAPADLVLGEGASGGSLPLIKGEWVELRIEIDLDADTQQFFYDGQLLYSGTWSNEVSGGGVTTFDTIDLFANNASAVFYDDISIAPAGGGGGGCDSPADVPWLSASPTSGTTPGGGSTPVTVSVDASGLTPGDYSALLCATTNDPLAELVEIPVDLTVTEIGEAPVIDVDPASFSFTLPAGGTDADDLGISNIGEGTLSWTIDTAEPPALGPTVGMTKADVMAREERMARAATSPKTRLLPSERPAVPQPTTEYVRGGDIVGDGGFEAGSPNPVWTEASTNFGTPLCTVGGCGQGGGTGPHSGSWWAWFGGTQALETGSVSQSVTIPSAGSAELRFWLEIPVVDPAGGFLDVSLDGDVLFNVTEADGPFVGYQEVVIDVSAYADGGTYELRFDSTTQPGAGVTNFFVDDVSITVGGGGGEGCDNPTTIPWLSVTPDSGDTDAGQTDLASVMVDAGALTPGSYSALLCVNSNDPVTPVVEVPVDLTVIAEGPIADITPESFSFEVPQGGGEMDVLNVGNTGTADLEWEIAEDVPAPPLGAGDPVDFPADPGSLGPIPDSPGGCQEPGAPRDVTFTVSGLPAGALADVQVAVTGSHTWVGDLVATLIAPDGTTMFDLFGYTGAIDDVSAGDSSNFGGPYTFSDGATSPPSGGWWQEAAVHETDGVLSSGTYRTTQRGGAGTPNPAPATELTAAFAGVTDANGTWTLRVTDGCGLDTGQITAATLTLTPGTPPICDDVTEVPWLSATPTSGVTEPGTTDIVDVAVDATGLDVGTYEAALCVTTNDPLAPTVTVPVTMEVTEAFPLPEPVALVVDPDEFISSNGNLVFEPGEVVHVAPSWQNTGGASVDLSGTAMNFTGPAGATYSTVIDSATYGVVAGGATASCLDQGPEMCYALGVDDPATRPAAHWDATFDEELSEGTTNTWTLHVGGSFTDVVDTSIFYPWIETLFHSGVTGGCAAGQYCPASPNTRGQMAVFLLKALEGPGYAPPACVEGSEVFADVPFDNLFCSWIEELAGRGVTAGCGGGNYCPNASVQRDQMSVFLLKTLLGTGYVPPACTGVFGDVACPSLFANWIEDLVDRGITAGCGGGNYCPSNPVSRDQMAVFLSRTFGLTLYGP